MPSIGEYFEWAARRYPSKCAVRGAGREVTYDQLNQWADRVADELRAYEREARIGVLLDHEPSAVAAILGVLKAGKTCVPLDYLRAVDRLERPLADAGLGVIVCDERDVTKLSKLQRQDVRTILVGDGGASDPSVSSRAGEASLASQDDSAFIVYTSGSTGQPKGVIRTHHSYCGLVGESSWFLKPTDRCLLLTRCHTSQGVSIISQAVMSGATLCLWDRGIERALIDYIRGQEITVLWMTPSVFRVLVRTLDAADELPGVRVVRMDGESVRRTDFESFKQFFRAPCVFVNSLGSTESGCYARNVITSDAVVTDDVLPVGLPPPGVEVAIVDDTGVEVGPGQTGELAITASWLSPGYWNRPDETQLRFRRLADGRRAFFSGDFGTRNAGGQLVHLGRQDYQVKIWGYRVELGGIEAQLRRLASVRDAVVSVREDAVGETRLVAHVTAKDAAAPPTIESLRDHLNRDAKLPEYMVPSAFVVLAALPLTPNGKVDRKALRASDLAANRRVDAEPQRFVAPRSPTEAALAAIWTGVLGIERVSVEDNFFHLGGHSLLVMRLVASIRRDLGVELATREAFEHPTIAGQAARLDTTGPVTETLADGPGEQQLVELVSAWSEQEVAVQLAQWNNVELELAPSRAGQALSGARRELYDRLVAQHRIDSYVSQPLARRAATTCEATFAQRRMWDIHVFDERIRLNNAQAFRIRGPLDAGALRQAVAALVVRQAALRTVFALDGDRLFQTVCDRGPDLEEVDLSSCRDSERTARLRILFDTIGRLDLGLQSFRAQLVRFDAHDHVLLTAAHHVVLDGFARAVLWSDLPALYRAAVSGTQPGLSELEFQFADFCFWQTTLVDRPVGKRQLEFWASTVAGYEEVELPGDLSAPARARGAALATYAMGAVPFSVEGASWDAVTRLCARVSVLPYSVIVTALFLFLTRASGRREACAMSGSHHRYRPGSEKLIGNFVTPYPLRIAFDEDATLEQAARHCNHAVFAHREHQGVGPVTTLAWWSDVTRYNLNYVVAPEREDRVSLGDASLEPVSYAMDQRRTVHDLALYLRQGVSGIRGTLAYNAERFSPALLDKLATRLRSFVDIITSEPSRRVRALPRSV